MKPSDGPNTQEIHEIPALHSLVPCNSLGSKLILKKTAKDQGCLGIKGATSPLYIRWCQGTIRVVNYSLEDLLTTWSTTSSTQ